MAEYPVLQSGFVCMHTNRLERPPPYDDLMVKRLLMKDYMMSNLDQFYLPDVVHIYEHWRRAPDVIRDFDFRERVLITAYQAFKTESMLQWLLFQNKAANLGYMHEAFLKDTMLFVSGENRSINIVQWVKLIEYSRHPERRQFDAGSYFEQNRSGMGVPVLFHEFIQLWVSRVGGFEDLLQTLYIIFGNHPYIVNVREKEL